MMLAYEVRVQRSDSELSFEGIASCTAPIMLIHSIQEKLRSEDHTSRKKSKKVPFDSRTGILERRELRNRLTEAGSTTIEKRGTVLHHYHPTSDILTLIDLTVLFRLVSSSAIFSLGEDF